MNEWHPDTEGDQEICWSMSLTGLLVHCTRQISSTRQWLSTSAAYGNHLESHRSLSPISRNSVVICWEYSLGGKIFKSSPGEYYVHPMENHLLGITKTEVSFSLGLQWLFVK